jgi:hypothetical protein
MHPTIPHEAGKNLTFQFSFDSLYCIKGSGYRRRFGGFCDKAGRMPVIRLSQVKGV